MKMNLNYNDPLEHVQMNNIGNRGSNDEGVVSGLEVTQYSTPNMSVDVSIGNCFIAGGEEEESGITNVPITSAHATLRRKDLIVYDASSNAPIVVTGTATVTPIPPAFTSDQILLAIINVAAATTTILNTDIQDSRCYVNTIPKDIIALWSGSEASIPYGWKICDGTNSTPDLRDKFIVGAGTTYAVTTTGGATQHRHLWQGSGTLNDGNSYTSYASNLPPYYALCYIMRD